jgi:hypothetical protein
MTTNQPHHRDPRHAPDLRLRTDHVLSINGRRYKMGGVPVGASGRREQGGQMVPGPWAYVFELATVMDDSGTGTGAESVSMRAAGTEHVLSESDRVVFNGHIEIRRDNTCGGRLAYIVALIDGNVAESSQRRGNKEAALKLTADLGYTEVV